MRVWIKLVSIGIITIGVVAAIFWYPVHEQSCAIEAMMRRDNAAFVTTLKETEEAKSITTAEYQKDLSKAIEDRQKVIVQIRGSFTRIAADTVERIASVLNTENEVLRARSSEIDAIDQFQSVGDQLKAVSLAFDITKANMEASLKRQDLPLSGYNLARLEQLLPAKQQLDQRYAGVTEQLHSQLDKFHAAFLQYEHEAKQNAISLANSSIQSPPPVRSDGAHIVNELENAEFKAK